MDELRVNLEPGNADGHSVLRYLMEVRQMPLEFAIEKVQQATAKFAQEYRGDKNKLMGGLVATVVLGCPIFFPFGIPSALLVGSIIGSAIGWQESAAKMDRLKPEYDCLKGSMLLQQFIKWLAEQLKEQSAKALGEGKIFQSDLITPANILAAYEHTILAVTNGEHLDNNASDPVLALFVAKLRQHTNHLPDWVMQAFQQLELAEVERAAHLNQVQAYMWGAPPNQNIGITTRLGAVDVPAKPVEGEQGLGKPPTGINQVASALPHAIPAPETAFEILDTLVVTRRSTLLIGDTGAGKSVTQAYILSKLFENHPSADVYVLTQKTDSFCGLAEKGRVTLFDPTEPEEALALITKIWIIYDKRRRLPESDRPSLHPVRLILADWLSINQALEDLKNEEEVKNSKYLTKLADIIYNGRELNVCLLVDLQSYNLAAVGLKADRNSRKNFNLIGLGNYSIDELGMVNESYGVLINLIGDRYIVADESERTALNVAFKELQPISKENQRPIIFSGLSPARLALLPDLRKYKTSTIVASSKQPITTPELPETLCEEEKVHTQVTNNLNVSDVLADNLAEPLKTIWLFAKKKGDWVTAKDIYKNGMSVLKGKSVKNIRQYLGILADKGFGEIDEMDGDKPKADSVVGFRAH